MGASSRSLGDREATSADVTAGFWAAVLPGGRRPAMDRYGKRFDRFGPVRVSHATVAMIDDSFAPFANVISFGQEFHGDAVDAVA
jgi:hypothetical protein